MRTARLVMLVVTLALLYVGWRSTWVRIAPAADNPGFAFRSAVVGDHPLLFDIDGGGEATAALAGVELTGVVRTGRGVTVALPAGLPEGGYDLEISADRPFPFGRTTARWTLVVDDVAPAIVRTDGAAAIRLGEAVIVTGETEPGADVVVDDPAGTPVTVEISPEGRFTVTFAGVPGEGLVLRAVDAAGNETALPVGITVRYPEQTRAAHISGRGWANPEIRRRLLSMADEGLIDTVQLDLKDESGVVVYGSQVPLAQRIGAVEVAYDLDEAIATLRAHGVRVIGRIVAFHDPVLATWAWNNGHRDWVLQDLDGEPLSRIEGFTNYAALDVQDYNLALAAEAAAAGVGDILWDHLRRPAGDPGEMVVPGLTGTGRTTGEEIVAFLGRGRTLLRPLSTYQGVVLLGIAAAMPENIGQPVDAIATTVDYVAPVLFPDRYLSGQCGEREPAGAYQIVRCTLEAFRAELEGTPTALVALVADNDTSPGLLGEQLRALDEVGTDGFVLWNASGTYRYTG